MIEDFGGIIPGAKKEMAQIRRDGGLKTENASAWDMKRRAESVNRNECFPSPNYRQMYESGGYSKEACFYIKKVRESLASSPAYKKASYLMKEVEKAEPYKGTSYYDNLKTRLDNRLRWIQDCYMEALDYFQNELLSVKTRQDINRAMFRLNDYCERRTDQGDLSFLTPKTRAAVKAFSRPESEIAITTEMERTHFLYSSDDKILAKYDIFLYKTGMVEIYSADIGTLRYLVLNIDNKTSNFYDSSGTNKLFYLKNWTDNTYFITDKETGRIIANNFSSEKDAKTYITDNLKNASKASNLVQFAPEGLENPERTGVDYLLGKNVTGDMMLDTFGIYGGQFGEWENDEERQYHLNKSFEALKDLSSALGISDKDISLGGKLGIAWGARGSGAAPSHYEHFYKVINLTKTAGAGFLCKEWAMALNNYAADVLDLKGNFATDKESESNPFKKVMEMIKFGGRYSEYLSSAQKMDKCVSRYNNRSWASNEELFARAFACYVKDKLSPEKSDYLVGQADKGSFKYKSLVLFAYPRGEERIRINAAFDELISSLKEKGLLHDRSSPEPLKSNTSNLKEQLSAFEKLMDNGSVNEVYDYFQYVLEQTEIFDKEETINIDGLINGMLFLEECSSEQMLSKKQSFIKNFSEFLEDVSLNGQNDLSEKIIRPLRQKEIPQTKEK